jgi:hypothetical protein
VPSLLSAVTRPSQIALWVAAALVAAPALYAFSFALQVAVNAIPLTSWPEAVGAVAVGALLLWTAFALRRREPAAWVVSAVLAVLALFSTQGPPAFRFGAVLYGAVLLACLVNQQSMLRRPHNGGAADV